MSRPLKKQWAQRFPRPKADGWGRPDALNAQLRAVAVKAIELLETDKLNTRPEELADGAVGLLAIAEEYAALICDRDSSIDMAERRAAYVKANADSLTGTEPYLERKEGEE